MNAPTSPIAASPVAVLGAFAEMLIDMIAEAEQAGQSTGMFRLIAKLTALIVDRRGVEDAARFALKVGGLDVVDDPSALTSVGGPR